MKNVFLALFFFLFITPAFSQVDFKISPGFIFGGTNNVALEVGLGNNWSLDGQLATSFRDLRTLRFIRDLSGSAYRLSARRYLGKETKLNGLYFGPYADVKHGTRNESDPSLNTANRYRAGATGGYKLLLGERFSIDYTVAAPVYDSQFGGTTSLLRIYRGLDQQLTVGIRF